MHLLDTSLPLHYDIAISSDGQVALVNFKVEGEYLLCKSILVCTPQKEIDISVNQVEMSIKMSGEALVYSQSIITPDEGEEYIKLLISDSFIDIFWSPDKRFNYQDDQELDYD